MAVLRGGRFLLLPGQLHLPDQFGLAERILHSVLHKTVYCFRLGEPHFPLRRMNVHVHLSRIDRQKEHADREGALHHQVSVAILDGFRDHAALDIAAVDTVVFHGPASSG